MLYNTVRDLAARLSCCSFQFVRRDGNLIAHELARLARVEGLVGCWMNRPPEAISTLVQYDCKDIINNVQEISFPSKKRKRF
jgi:hypothetical protein